MLLASPAGATQIVRYRTERQCAANSGPGRVGSSQAKRVRARKLFRLVGTTSLSGIQLVLARPASDFRVHGQKGCDFGGRTESEDRRDGVKAGRQAGQRCRAAHRRAPPAGSAPAASQGQQNAQRNLVSVAFSSDASTRADAFVLVAPSGKTYLRAGAAACLACLSTSFELPGRFNGSCPQPSHDGTRGDPVRRLEGSPLPPRQL
jgi:hypothetical protein